MGQLITGDQVKEYYGTNGVNLVTDDSVTDTRIEDGIGWAEAEVFKKLSFKYEAYILAQSPDIERICILLTAWYVSGRRGNPRLFGSKTVDDFAQ